jgi:Arc/MetJ-type ribon-helix-helix transcriptional regulator
MAVNESGKNPKGVVYVKIPSYELGRLDRQIEKGVFRSRSDGLRQSLSRYLDILEDRQRGQREIFQTDEQPE